LMMMSMMVIQILAHFIFCAVLELTCVGTPQQSFQGTTALQVRRFDATTNDIHSQLLVMVREPPSMFDLRVPYMKTVMHSALLT